MSEANQHIGQVIILNGVPRAGKTPIAEEIRELALKPPSPTAFERLAAT